MTCICFSQLFMKLCVYLSRCVARRNKNMLLDLVKNYKEQGFQLKWNRESHHLMFKISKISLSRQILAPTHFSTKKLILTLPLCLLVSSLKYHILKKGITHSF